MPAMKMNRNYILRTKSGHVIHFHADEEVYVPPPAQAEAQAVGAIPVDPGESVVPEDASKPDGADAVSLSPDVRAEKLNEALRFIKNENNPDHFTAAGAPKINIVRSVSGVPDIQVRESNTAWDALNTPEE